MKKVILSAMLLASLVFTGCSDDDDDSPSCKICSENTVSVEICDNGDGTVTFTASVAGQTVFTNTDDFDGDETLDDIDCDDLELSDFDLDFPSL